MKKKRLFLCFFKSLKLKSWDKFSKQSPLGSCFYEPRTRCSAMGRSGIWRWAMTAPVPGPRQMMAPATHHPTATSASKGGVKKPAWPGGEAPSPQGSFALGMRHLLCCGKPCHWSVGIIQHGKDQRKFMLTVVEVPISSLSCTTNKSLPASLHLPKTLPKGFETMWKPQGRSQQPQALPGDQHLSPEPHSSLGSCPGPRIPASPLLSSALVCWEIIFLLLAHVFSTQ